MKIQEMNPELLTPYQNNPRKITASAVREVAKSIKEYGFKQPIVVDKNNIVIVGHTRLRAAKALGMKTVPVIVSDLNDKQARSYRLADNRTGDLIDWDNERLADELKGLGEVAGFTDEDLNKAETRLSNRIAFGYYGGKNQHLGWILPLLAAEPGEKRFMELFCGSAAVALNRNSPGVVIINDLDGRVINFFKQLRDNPKKLIRAIGLSPYSRAECESAMVMSGSKLEQARSYFVLVTQSWNKSVVCGWSRRMDKNPIVGRHDEALMEVAAELSRFTFENRDVFKLMDNFNSKDTFMYLDPPYLGETRVATSAYAHEAAGVDFHKQLLERIKQSNCRIGISGYASDIYDNELCDWTRHEHETIASSSNNLDAYRKEVLWTNY